MKYTFEEYKKLRAEHDKEMECIDWIDSNDFVKLYNKVCDIFINHPESYCVTMSRPVLTLEGFQADTKLWKWLNALDEDHKPIVAYYPAMGYWGFFKTGKDMQKFNDNGPWKDDIIYNIRSIDVWEKLIEVEYKNGTKKNYWLDEVEINKA